MRVAIGDVELHVHEKGVGRPLLALHGGPGIDGSVWFPALDALAGDGWRILAPDHRANGRSDAGDPARWTVPQMADDVEELIRRLDLADPVVMGWSFGSFVAQSHLARHGSASAYVLVGTVSGPEALHGVHERLAAFEPEHLRDRVTSSWERESTVQTAEDCKRLMDDQWAFHVADPEGPLVTWLRENDRVVYRPEVLRHFAAGGEYGLVDLRAELSRSTRPVLVISGAHDRTTPAASAQELVDAIPGAEHLVLPGSAHMLPYEEPDAFIAGLQAFLTRI
ncbi:MAG TPA: alpha/beta hydrolase [Gaiella sp.]|uniref:alpha/beta fold hydrolase n=1 Tax=Gaiella sp. TaxID=2663207 RepID=UPI002D810FA3|nr:alpha/beta hydrolase [Gaiella sp.]HET9287954.1 alpha/beta hydrolase [Gaiella sp.]